MTMMSDPSVRAAERPSLAHFDAGAGALHVVSDPHHLVPRSRRTRVWGIYAVIGVAAVVVALRLLASLLAVPLDTVAGGAAPTWMVEVTTSGAKAGTALVYGSEVGMQLVQIPAGDGDASDARVVPARLAKGELHLVSLSLTSLRVYASAPHGVEPMSFFVTSHIITAFQTRRGTGVRTGW